MPGSAPFAIYTPLGTIYYTPTTASSESVHIARFPNPPCRPRQRRRNLIHITNLPANFELFEFRSLPPPLRAPARAPSRVQLFPRSPILLRKLASRRNAKRVLGTAFFSFSSNSSAATSSTASSTSPTSADTSLTLSASLSTASADPTTIYSRRAGSRTSVDDLAMSRRTLTDRPAATAGGNSPYSGSNPPPKLYGSSEGEPEKPIVSANGVSLSIILAEPTIYLVGLDHDGTTRDSQSNSTAILRGKLQLNVTKSAKIRAVVLKFKGKARTEWPEGIPPAKTEFFEEESLRTQVLPFFNALHEGAESGYGTLCNYVLHDKSASTSVINLSSTTIDRPSAAAQSSVFSLPTLSNRSIKSSTMLSTKELKRLSLQSNQSRSFQKGDSPFGPTPQQKGYKVFHPGVYEYSFEIPIDNNSPETTKLPLASVTWMLEVLLERAGTFKANLQGFKEIPVVRSPSEDSLELVEPISISRRWEDQLHYDIMISGKSFPLGSRIPIAFKLTPLAKVQVHKIKVYVSENVEYFTNDQRVTRRDVTRKILLLEKNAGKPLAKEYASSELRVLAGGELSPEEREEARNVARRYRDRDARRAGTDPEPLPEPTDNMLGDIDLGLEGYWGQTEMELDVQLPTCASMEKDKSKRLVHDCTWKNVNVHHWIKIVMRISRADTDDPTGKKRRHFEISIDSPFTILTCHATQANLALPEYSGWTASTQRRERVCGCPNAANSNSSPSSSSGSIPTLGSMDLPEGQPASPGTFTNLARPPQAHLSTNAAAGVQRPIHMLRNPSYNPPAFDAEEPPPPIATPPPHYDQIIGTPSHDGLADYFARLSEVYDDDDSTDDEDTNRVASRGRVNVANPRTPGGRLVRSMDIDRNFMFNPVGFNNSLSGASGTATEVPAT